jgi:hypothetical protein
VRFASCELREPTFITCAQRGRDVCLTVNLFVQQIVMFASSQQRIPAFETRICLSVINSEQNNMFASPEQK